MTATVTRPGLGASVQLFQSVHKRNWGFDFASTNIDIGFFCICICSWMGLPPAWLLIALGILLVPSRAARGAVAQRQAPLLAPNKMHENR